MQKKSFIILVSVLAALALGVTLWAFKPPVTAPSSTSKSSATPTTAGIEGLGGTWSLIDHDGQIVSDRDVTGSYRLMFFGFTYCPDICPTELKRLSMVLEGLGSDAEKIKPLFVSIDPERDTPEVLKEYLSRFDSRITGLTGTVDQIKHMEKIFKVYSAKAEDPAYSDYMVNHSALVYLISPDDKVLHLFHSKDTPEQMISHIKELLETK